MSLGSWFVHYNIIDINLESQIIETRHRARNDAHNFNVEWLGLTSSLGVANSRDESVKV